MLNIGKKLRTASLNSKFPGSYEKKCTYGQGCRSLLSIGGDNFQFYPNFALFSTLGGMNFDHDFVQVSKLSEDQKKKVFTKNGTFFPQIQVKTKKKKGGLHQQWNTFFPRI